MIKHPPAVVFTPRIAWDKCNFIVLMLCDDKLVLRRIKNEDAHAMASLANNKKIWLNVRDILPHPYTIDDALFFINLIKNENPQLSFAMQYDNTFCGMIGLQPMQDVYRITSEIGYWLGEPFWNKGIATTAVALLTDYAFTTLDFVRIHAGIFEYNTASMKVLQKNGYTKEAVFEKSVIKDGKIVNEHRYCKINPAYV